MLKSVSDGLDNLRKDIRRLNSNVYTSIALVDLPTITTSCIHALRLFERGPGCKAPTTATCTAMALRQQTVAHSAKWRSHTQQAQEQHRAIQPPSTALAASASAEQSALFA